MRGGEKWESYFSEFAQKIPISIPTKMPACFEGQGYKSGRRCLGGGIGKAFGYCAKKRVGNYRQSGFQFSSRLPSRFKKNARAPWRF
jgi:hypothetical protein